MRLADQVILITGSTTGIGAAMARRFVREGAKVLLHGRDAERGLALRDELGHARMVGVPVQKHTAPERQKPGSPEPQVAPARG